MVFNQNQQNFISIKFGPFFSEFLNYFNENLKNDENFIIFQIFKTHAHYYENFKLFITL